MKQKTPVSQTDPEMEGFKKKSFIICQTIINMGVEGN